MRTVREQYLRYSLFVLILVLGTAIFVKMLPFMGGLLGAATIYILLRGQMHRLTERRGWHRGLAAGVLIGEAILCFLVPASLIVWMLAVRIEDVTLDPQTLLVPLKNLAALIDQRTGYNLLSQDNISSLVAFIPELGQKVVGGIASFVVNIIVLLFVLYFMLIGGRRMEDYARGFIPFDREQGDQVVHEIHMIVRSNALGIPLLAVLQGTVACLGYLAMGVPNALFWGVITCFATIIPIVGTSLVWFPLAVYLALKGSWGQAVGLFLYGALVITYIDNLMRMVLQKRMADTHPLITVFGVIIGLSLFGFMGVIFGPLLLDLFVYCANFFKHKYLDPPASPAQPVSASPDPPVSGLSGPPLSAVSDLKPAAAAAAPRARGATREKSAKKL